MTTHLCETGYKILQSFYSISTHLGQSRQILFQPCCDVNIINVEADCTQSGDPGNYDITITLDKSVNMLGNGLMLVLVDKSLVTVDENVVFSYNDSTKIVLIFWLSIKMSAGLPSHSTTIGLFTNKFSLKLEPSEWINLAFLSKSAVSFSSAKILNFLIKLIHMNYHSHITIYEKNWRKKYM